MKNLWGYTEEMEARTEQIDSLMAIRNEEIWIKEFDKLFPLMSEQIDEEVGAEYTLSDGLWMLLILAFDCPTEWKEFRRILNTKLSDLTKEDGEKICSIIESWGDSIINFTRT